MICPRGSLLLLQGGKSRVDFVLETSDGGSMYVEVKSVTLAEPLTTSDAPLQNGGLQHSG